MKFGPFAIAALLASVSAVPASAAVFVDFHPGVGVVGNYTVVQDFESSNPGDDLGTNAIVFDSNASGVAARPAFGSTGNYLAVLGGGSGVGQILAVNPQGVSSFGFVIGSVDTYNTLTLELTDGTTIEYVGGQIINDLSFPSGNQIVGETNGFVTFTSDGARFARFTLGSSQNAFELDNIAIAAVPEPATWAMMIGGMGLVGGTLRRRKTTVAFA